ncbi:peptidase S9 [bacterium]|nr:peptidase S9 [bacterium]|tara:strand:- start:21001 stop:22971 length:1971 start_codon:yes stop_codon:yes gene_type:complete
MMKKELKNFSIKDIRKIIHVSDPVINPKKNNVCYVLKKAHKNTKKNCWKSEIAITDLKTFKSKRISSEEFDAFSPKWSPSGKTLAFLSKRTKDEHYQIYLLDMEGGEARKFTKQKNGINSFKFSPNGKSIIFTSFDDPEKSKYKDSFADDVEVIDSAFWRLNGQGSFLRKRNHLFVQKIKSKKSKKITSGKWSVGSWYAQDDKVLYSRTPNPENDMDQAMSSELYSISLQGGKEKKITSFGKRLHTPIVSGGQIYVIANDMKKSWASNDSLYEVQKNKKLKKITGDFEFGIGDSMNCDTRFPSGSDVWVSSSLNKARFVATVKESLRLVELDIKKQTWKYISDAGHSVIGYSQSKDGKSRIELRTSPISFPELWFVDDDKKAIKITKYNDNLASKRRFFKPEKMTFEASDKTLVDAWIIKPRLTHKKKVPAILEIHGGPKTVYGNAIMLEFQMLAGEGFAVIYGNPRGSDGYGVDWAHSVFKKYGERDYEDLIESVQESLKKHKQIDEKRLGVCGGSYGGFMTNWIIGHTDMFKAAVTQRGISNFTSMFGTSDIGYFFDIEQIGKTPWENSKVYLEKSPITYVENMKAATLIIHSEQDLRCPIEQAEQLFISLKMLGQKVSFARFPNETHELSRSGSPNRKMERLRLLINWFKNNL